MKKQFRLSSKFMLVAMSICLVAILSLLQPHNSGPLTLDPTHPVSPTNKPRVVRSDEQAKPKKATKSPRSDVEVANTVLKQGKSERLALNDKGRPTKISLNGKQYPVHTYKPLATPNDPLANQWWVNSTGLNTAWDYTPGTYQTTVAVIDTGFALGHEEFDGRWKTNSGEQGVTATEGASDLNCTDQGIALDMACNNIDDDMDGVVDNESGAAVRENPSDLNCTDQGILIDMACNNIDDDGNGLVDDVTGWDFINFDSSVQAGETNPNGPGTSHGTMVSGILAANANNGTGIAGVNWSTKILPIQALDDDEYGNTLSVARGIIYAADQRADIISISLGATETDQYLREAIEYALNAGALVVAASGNDGCDCINYPANFPEVLAVGSSNRLGGRSSFSNYGSNLDLIAPGESMASSTWAPSDQTTAYQSGIAGTSFSTPYTSGLLALAKSQLPSATWGELTAALTEESSRTGLSATNPRSNEIGFGIAQADNLLERATTPDNAEIRYQFGPIAADDALGSHAVVECSNGRLPSTAIYELKRNLDIRLTTSDLVRLKATQDGWSSKRLFYACSGLPPDTVSAPRTINLLHEIYNRYDKN